MYKTKKPLSIIHLKSFIIIQVLLLIFIFSSSLAQASVHQRMAIPTGSISIAPKSSKNVNAFCLDYTRHSPAQNMDYSNLLSGASSAVVNIGGHTTMSLAEALSKNIVSINGTGNHLNMKFKSNVDEAIEIIIDENLQLGNKTESISRANVKAMKLGEVEALDYDSSTISKLQFLMGQGFTEQQFRLAYRAGEIDENVYKLSQQLGRQQNVWENNDGNTLEQLYALGLIDKSIFKKGQLKDAVKHVRNKRNIQAAKQSESEIFDGKMEAYVRKLEAEISQDLVAIGISEPSILRSLKRYQNIKNLDETGVYNDTISAAIKDDVNKSLYYRPDGGVVRTEIRDDGNRYILAGDQLRFPLPKNGDFTAYDKLMGELKDRKFDKDELRFLVMSTDANTMKAAKEKFGNQLITGVKSVADFTNTVEANKRKTVFIMGHAEKNTLTMDDRLGNGLSLDMNQLNKMRQHQKVNFVFLGCESGLCNTTNSGFVTNVNSLSVVNNLSDSISKSDNFFSLFNNLSKNDTPVLISENIVPDLGFMRIQATKRKAAIAGTVIEVSTGLSSDSQEEKK